MASSIICNEMKCFICGSTQGLHKHHIFYGTANRVLAEKHGLWVGLCFEHHTGSKYGVHFNHPFDVMLKKYAQERWEAENGGSREDFIKIFGKSYL